MHIPEDSFSVYDSVFANSARISSIRLSGADAPEDSPIFFMLFISFQFIKFTSDIKYEFTQPSFFATSTSLCELEEFSDPTIS